MSQYGSNYGGATNYGGGDAVTVQTSTTGTFRTSWAFRARAVTNTLLRMGRWFGLALMFGSGV